MRRLLPYPVLAVALVAMWLLLNQSVSLGALLLGGILAVGATAVLMTLAPPPIRIRRLGAAVDLFMIVLAEVVRSNNAVALLILTRARRERRSQFVRVALETRNPYVLAGLACILTATPGTVWVDYDSADGTVLIHVLDLIDEEAWVRIVKDVYEKRLLEIFE
jgi:multicomponent K+:H+ antiporter subunit E